jgi:hypothetical protein
MATIGSLTLGLSVESATFIREINRSTEAVNRAAREMSQQSALMQRGFDVTAVAVKGLAAGLAGVVTGVGIAGLARMAKQSLDTADALADLNAQTGLSVEAIQAFQRMATLTGSSAEAFNSGLLNMTRGLGQLQGGTGRLLTQLQKLDPVLADQFKSVRDQERALDLVAESLQRAGSEAGQQAIAVAVFGDAGRELAVAFREGAEGLEQAREASARMGEISLEAARAAQQANDELDKLAMTLSTSVSQAFLAAAPQIQGFAYLMNEAVIGVRDFFEELNAGGAAKLNFQIADINEQLAKLHAQAGDIPWPFSRANANEIARLTKIRDELIAQRDAMAAVTQVATPLEVSLRKQFDVVGDLAGATKALTDQQKRLADAGKILTHTSGAEERAMRDLEQSMHQMERLASLSELKGEGMMPPVEQDKLERSLSDPFKNALESVQSEFTSTFEQINTGGVRTFEDLASSAEDIFSNLNANLLSLAVFDPKGFSARAAQSGLTGGQLMAATAVTTATPAVAGAVGGQAAPQWAAMGGAFGTAAGAAIGTWLLPGLGTVGGSILGGAAGSILGGIGGGLFGGGDADEPPSARDLSGQMRARIIPQALGLGLNARAIAGRIGQFTPEQQTRNLETAIGLMRTIEGFRIGPVNAQFRDLSETFSTMESEARKFGVSIEGLAEARQRETEALHRQIRLQEITIGAQVGNIDDLDAALLTLNVQMQQSAAAAVAMGIPLTNITAQHLRLANALIAEAAAAERAAEAQADALALSIVEPFKRLADPLTAFGAELETSLLNPLGQMQDAAEDFRRITELARAGDLTAIGQFQAAGERFIEQAGRFGASPAQVSAIQEVAGANRDILAQIKDAELQAQRGIEDAVARAAQKQVDKMSELIAEVRVLVEEVKKNGRR